MLSMEQTEQERLYHLKNAMYLNVMQKPPAQRNSQALSAFMAYHAELQERVRTNQNLNEKDVSTLISLSRAV
ncbi:MAG TPA: hypothetical protein VGU68_09590 [Ktedonobacteraceae bacterium]|nr:hypothetical protein [Ktedonobacteraceae bacterium]